MMTGTDAMGASAAQRRLTPFAGICLLPAVLLVGCLPELVPFTNQDRLIYSVDQLQLLQVYNSDEIVLFRDVTHSERAVEGNRRLMTIGGRVIEIVTIPARTPGIICRIDQDRIAVMFERSAYLLFNGPPNRDGIETGEPRIPDCAQSGREREHFRLVQELDSDRFCFAARPDRELGGVVRYGVAEAGDEGETYIASSASADACLLVERAAIDRLRTRTRVVRGIRPEDVLRP